MAKGSHATRGDYPKLCAGCGQPVRVSKDHCWYETSIDKGGHPIDRSWHADCHPRLLNVSAPDAPIRFQLVLCDHCDQIAQHLHDGHGYCDEHVPTQPRNVR